ncbi:putative LRR receptor-like serine/threonine-protein kinase [Camellia lanceoleosa]|uniref:LRR receptor-like serine/threonine-protein kinase n=1 Tax=Camellia lanceoleosa TaxID=1840588 RepID=A0ACC0H4N0_9ERIC|nr:putative LRR receptor-like serine/threonine-protein kinase [Camellia lanceoleosa]
MENQPKYPISGCQTCFTFELQLPFMRKIPLDKSRRNITWSSLKGFLSPKLGELSSLQELILHGNNLIGSIPKEIGMLKYLKVLDLGNNQLSGPIPSELGSLTSLLKMNLQSNGLTGKLPSELGNLKYLEELRLDRNKLQGNVPATNSSDFTSSMHGMFVFDASGPIVDCGRPSSASIFVGGFVLGGIVVGALGCIYAPQISKALAGANRKDLMRKLPKFIYDEEKALERTRKILTEKIAQLNSAIDDVSSQLRADDTPNGTANWLEQSSFSMQKSNDNSDLESLVLLLKCLKIMENATFLSMDNQSHLLEMKRNLNHQGSPRTFTKLIISVINILSERVVVVRLNPVEASSALTTEEEQSRVSSAVGVGGGSGVFDSNLHHRSL